MAINLKQQDSKLLTNDVILTLTWNYSGTKMIYFDEIDHIYDFFEKNHRMKPHLKITQNISAKFRPTPNVDIWHDVLQKIDKFLRYPTKMTYFMYQIYVINYFLGQYYQRRSKLKTLNILKNNFSSNPKMCTFDVILALK